MCVGGGGSNALLSHNRHFSNINSVLVLASSFELVVCALGMPKHYNKMLNKIASLTLGIYLIHENPFINTYWWNLLRTQDMQDSRFLGGHILFSVVLTFVICGMIDLIRQRLFGSNIFFRINDRICNLLHYPKV